ncbi:hypothetical protein [Amycolatopsis magusensis]|uniref:Uncharacterized protein n=1 Tax=Amycolatopsis magusensis TaxID=882444 RepID=A0ABS4PTM9_9PSEU|nr:hypothetical protein [Amycolatopsis magusensis]MBP2182781.1 hypothetical protein [Amycolatopsis magusensis]
MTDGRSSRMIPRTRGACALYLLVGVLVTAGPIWRMVEVGEAAVLPVVAAVAGALVIVTAVIGLVWPGSRGR